MIIYLFIAFVTVSLMFFVAMYYYYLLESLVRRLKDKNEELQMKVDAWVTWTEENNKESETNPPGSV
jgi:predicted PurR-regulated permease PerM